MRTVTADGLVRSALRTLGVYAAGEDPEDDEITDSIESCNEMIDAWATNNLTIPSSVREQFNLVAQQQNYTIGSGGNFNTERPLSIDAASIVINSAPILAVSSITRVSTTATVTTTAPHGYATGKQIAIAGAVQTAYNGTKTITVTGNSTFTFTVAGSPTTPATGTITAQDAIGMAQELPMGLLTYDGYIAIPIKGLTNPFPSRLYYSATTPGSVGNIFVWPMPTAVYPIVLYFSRPLTQFDPDTPDAEVILAPGYAKALHWNLALELLPEYPRPDDSAVARIERNAQTSLADIKRQNQQISVLSCGDAGFMFGYGGYRYSIYSDSDV